MYYHWTHWCWQTHLLVLKLFFPSAVSHRVGVRECWEGSCWKTLRMPAGRSLKGILCCFVMRCSDKGHIYHISPCPSPAGPADPCWPETVITQSVLLAAWLMAQHCSLLVWPVVCLCCKGRWWFCCVLILWSCNLPLLPFTVASPLSLCVLSSCMVCMSSPSQLCLWVCCVEVLFRDKTLILVWWQESRRWREWGHILPLSPLFLSFTPSPFFPSNLLTVLSGRSVAESELQHILNCESFSLFLSWSTSYINT